MEPLTLDSYRTLEPAIWRGYSREDLGLHIGAYRRQLIKETLDTLPRQGKGGYPPAKTRISMAVYDRINSDTRTYPALGKESVAMTRALAQDPAIEKKDSKLCNNLAALAEYRRSKTKARESIA